MRSPALISILLFAAGACSGPTDQPDAPDETASLLRADSAFARETAAGGSAAWASWFEPDGSMVRGNGEIRGRGPIQAAMVPSLDDPAVRFTWAPQRAIHAGGDLGATIGYYRIESPVQGGTQVQRGMYMTLWRRQPDGSWKVAADLGSPAG